MTNYRAICHNNIYSSAVTCNLWHAIVFYTFIYSNGDVLPLRMTTLSSFFVHLNAVQLNSILHAIFIPGGKYCEIRFMKPR